MLSNCTGRFDELSAAIENSAGACENMYAIQLDNLNGDIDILKSGLSDLGISIYKDLNGPLREMTQLATSMVGELSEAYKGGGMEGMIGAVGGCMAEVVNTIADYAPQVVSMGVDLLENFISGITDNAGTLAAAAADVGAVFINGLFSLVPQVILAGIDIIVQLAQSITAQLPQLINNGTQAIVNFVNGIIQRLPEVISTALTLVQTLVNSIGQNAPMLISAAIQLIGNLVLGIASMLPQLLQMGIQLILSLVQGIISNLPQILQMGVQIIISLVSGITQMLPMVIQGGIQLIVSLLQGIIGNAGNILQAGWELVGALISGLIQAIPDILGASYKLIFAICDTVANTDWIQVGIDIINGILNGIKNMGDSIWGTIKSLFTGKEPPDMSGPGAEAAGSYISGINSNAGTVTAAVGNMTANAFSSMDTSGAAAAGIQAGTAFSTGLAGSMASGGLDTAAFGANMTNMGTAGAAALNTSLSAGLATPVDTSGLLDAGAFSTNMTAAGTQGAAAFTTGLNTGLSATTINTSALAVDTSGLTTAMATAGTQGATAIGTGMAGNSQAVTQAATALGNDVNTALDRGWDKANTSAQTAMQRLASTVTGAASSAAGAVKAAFENMAITIPKPRLPVINVSTSPVAYGDGGSVSVPNFSVSWNALGGIFDQPTIFNTPAGMQGVGEKGPEAVLPLDTLWAKMKEILNEAVAASSGASPIEAFIEKLKGIGTGGSGKPELAGTGGTTVQYSPVYNLYGSAGKEEIAEAGRMCQAEFNKLMKQYEKDRQRRKL
ncbi:phage tail tape measure protein [Lachnospiraceae bacterium 29-84]